MVFFKDGGIQTFIKGGDEHTEKILTAKITTGVFDFKNKTNNTIKISDDEEIIYGRYLLLAVGIILLI